MGIRQVIAKEARLLSAMETSYPTRIHGHKQLRGDTMDQERRGLRFAFLASAEIAPETSPHATITANVKELSLHGCYVETPAPFSAQTPVLVKIFKSDEYFESKATVVYSTPAVGMGLAFREVKPDFRAVMQKWLRVAMQETFGSKP